MQSTGIITFAVGLALIALISMAVSYGMEHRTFDGYTELSFDPHVPAIIQVNESWTVDFTLSNREGHERYYQYSMYFGENLISTGDVVLMHGEKKSISRQMLITSDLLEPALLRISVEDLDIQTWVITQ